jgi:Mn2+/Fe2+ NRAMP family transporter
MNPAHEINVLGQPKAMLRRSRRSFPGRFLSALGPGLIAGAADDDPAGIATYSSAGALLGTGQLWTAFLTWPLMAAVQMMCARIGMATGKGLSGACRRKFPRAVILAVALALLIANTFNIAADLNAMADAAEVYSGINSHYFVVFFAVAITALTIHFRYPVIATILKWLTLSLCAYILTALLIGPDWRHVAHATFIPTLPNSREGWAMLVAILGTTISPYLFFWQASQEVEETKVNGSSHSAGTQASARHLTRRRFDIGVGTFYSNVVMYFIILSTALTLHSSGITHIETSREAAEALRPFAGNLATLLFMTGVIGVGFLAIPTLSTSAAYALAETFGWRGGLNRNFKSARAFYGVIIISTLSGIALDFANVSAIRALFWSAVLNGLLAPFLLIAIVLVATDRKVMRNQPAPPLTTVLVGLTAVLMLGAAIGMFVL